MSTGATPEQIEAAARAEWDDEWDQPPSPTGPWNDENQLCMAVRDRMAYAASRLVLPDQRIVPASLVAALDGYMERYQQKPGIGRDQTWPTLLAEYDAWKAGQK